jgi:long-chain acyl-CoA synthetase
MCRDDPGRALVHVPVAHRAVAASDIWRAHLAYADALARIGIGEGRLVLSNVGNSPSAPALLLACRALDAAMMPLDPGSPPAAIDALAARFGAAALVTPSGVHPIAGAARSHSGAAVLKLTSGSTGSPKATHTTEAQLVADCTHIIAAMGIRPDDVQIAAIPVSHSYGLGNLLLPLLLQGTACVMRESFVPQLVPADARRFGARVFPAVPFMLQYFLDHPPRDGWPPTLSSVISAGAPMPPDNIRAFRACFGVTIHAFYGSSETGGITFDAEDEIGDSGTVGRPLPGVRVAVTEDSRAGRILVRSAAVSSGYADGADDDFVDGGFLTGDYGEWDVCGRLRLRGRVSSFVNVAGRKVQPDEVEEVLRAMPGIADARVVGAPDGHRGEQIVACLVADAGMPPITTLGVRRFCAERLAPHKIPRAIVFVDAMPLTARGKIDRAALDALVRAHLGG